MSWAGAGVCYGRAVRRTRAAIFSAAMVVAGVASATGAAAQTTTTIPPVRSIPVTPATTTTAAPVRTAGTAESASPQPAQTAADLADTGVAADRLVPLGLLLIGVGAALQGAARRPRRAYGLL